MVTNKRSEKQREELIAKFNHEREIDQQRYEEEKQRAIGANEAQRIRDHPITPKVLTRRQGECS